MASSTEKTPSKVADHYVFPIALPSLPSLPISATHYLYLKPETPNNPTPESARSLPLVNVPIDSTATHFKHLFSTQIGLPVGRIRGVRFEGDQEEKTPTSSAPPTPEADQSKKSKKRKRGAQQEPIPDPSIYKLPPTWDRVTHRSGSTATIEFVDKASMRAALKAARAIADKGKTVTWGEGIEDELPPLGSERYLTHQNLTYPPKADLLVHVNDYMTAYNAHQEAETQALARKRQEPDEDGFVTVTRGARNAVRMEEAKERLEKQRENKKELGDFYRFQGREKRKEREAELLRKFEADKEKVRRMRERRENFQPE